jgi:hypothetical protein
MAVVGSRVTVATTATRLDTSTAGNMARSSVLVRNRGAAAVDLGGSGVTSGAGFQLDPGEAVDVDIVASDSGLYGIAASGTVRCDVIQVGS